MARRFGANVQLWIYRFLVLRDGEQCARCFELPGVQNGRRQKLDIDHLDSDPFNNKEDNLRLLCPKCNISERNKVQIPHSPQNVCVRKRQRQEGQPATRIVRQVVDYRQGSPEMQASFLFEVDFRSWLLKEIQDHGSYLKLEAIASGAELSGCSVSTTARYLAKLLSAAGPLQEFRDSLGDIHLQLKDHLKEPPSIIIDLDNRTNVLKEKHDEREKELDRLYHTGEPD